MPTEQEPERICKCQRGIRVSESWCKRSRYDSRCHGCDYNDPKKVKSDWMISEEKKKGEQDAPRGATG